jgi:site-specific recombinase XerC
MVADANEFEDYPDLARLTATSIVQSCKESSLRSYKTGERFYARYCNKFEVPLEARYPPANRWILLRFITWAFFLVGKSHSTISSTLSAVKSYCTATGKTNGSFQDPLVKLQMKSLHRREGSTRKRPQRFPVTLGVLMLMLPRVAPFEIAAFAAMVVGFHGLFRASEIVARDAKNPMLLRKHVTFFKDRVVIHVARSKTDTFDEGVDVTIHATNGPLCPLLWLKTAMDRAIDKRGEAPVFQRPNGAPMTYAYFQNFIKRMCVKTGLPQGFSSHSLRIGGASTLIALGFSVDAVKKLGRWKSYAYATNVLAPNGLHQRVSRALQQAVAAGSSPAFCGISCAELASFNSTNIDGLPQLLRNRTGR